MFSNESRSLNPKSTEYLCRRAEADINYFNEASLVTDIEIILSALQVGGAYIQELIESEVAPSQ